MTRGPSWIHHDPLCPTTATCGTDDCPCLCLCDLIAEVREDERRNLAPYLTRNDHAIAAENRP